jgi:C-terminal processing protease CtpA/Prc
MNSGGNLWPMLAGVGPLLGDGELGASVYPDGTRRPIWYRDGRAGFGDYVQLRVMAPYRLARSEAPVAVLLGPRTASSAEVLATALRGRSDSRSFGASTSGLAAGNRTFELADRAALVLTVAGTADRAGNVIVGAIVPDEPVAQASGAAAIRADALLAGVERPDPVLGAAMSWLESERTCR